jgi:cephalosporin-C deacetylase-like acetyl esterase
MKPTVLLLSLAAIAFAQEAKKPKTGLDPEDWKYTLAPGVTTRDVTYYSDGVACFAKLFFPKGFSAQSKTPGVVLGQGWAGTHFSIEKYGARFAERGLVALVIDYRGWGSSDGFPSIINTKDRVGGDYHRDDKRFSELKADDDLRAIPVVVLTTSQAEADIVRSYELHANAYVIKPIDAAKFADAIKQIDEFFLILTERPQR